jgi:hypothetical protein
MVVMPEVMTLGEPEVPEPLLREPEPVVTTAAAEPRSVFERSEGMPYHPAADHPWQRFPIVRPRCQPALSTAIPKL